MLFSNLLFSVLGCLSSAVAATDTPNPPGLSYLYTLNCTLGAPIVVGASPTGTRVAIPIIGGTFSGPRLSGKVLNLGADWGLTTTNPHSSNSSTFHADTRYNLQTNDRVPANIFVQTSGPAQGDGKLHLRMVFETGDERYYWLNGIVAVGVLTPGTGWVGIEGWYLRSGGNGK
ncbi:hypothetical protein GQ43DRAFT_441337 [Delitschia confertaspora ATCC 74209]|uniref:Uncharacterized protein n=1 Tax=Delitschia confertaspora ATCC 74209 TaxID=1513339 RepID=A0A9P4JK96_9PLEO|nr:hypothetical protein GQ43DRAFT_441337 [Delitschia confertaspora ATCC 74209]